MRVKFPFIPIVSSRVMNNVLKVTKMVLSLEQCVFIVKRYYETHSSNMFVIFYTGMSKFCISILIMVRDVARGGVSPSPHILHLSAFPQISSAIQPWEKNIKRRGKTGEKYKNNKKTCTAVESKNSFLVQLYHNHTYP